MSMANPSPLWAKGKYYDLYMQRRLTKADFKEAKDSYRTILCGSPRINDTAYPDVRAKLEQINSQSKQLLETINRDAGVCELWGDTPLDCSDDMSKQAMAVYRLARAWGTSGCELYQSEQLLEAVTYALEWFYQNLYGQKEIDGCGWRDVHDFNWYDWFVSVPVYLFRTMLVIEEELTKEQITAYTSCYNYLTGFMRPGKEAAMAQSRIWAGTLNALLNESQQLMAERNEEYNTLTEIVHSLTRSGEREDYSHWSHEMAYNHCYGHAWLQRVIYNARVLAGTPLAFDMANNENLLGIARYMFGILLYDGRAMTAFNGRFWGASEENNGADVILALTNFFGLLGEEADRELSLLLARNLKREKMQQLVLEKAELYQLPALRRVLSPEMMTQAGDLTLSHAYYMGDKAVVHRDGYAMCLSMSSVKTPHYESINGCNFYGWHTGDGVLYVYTKADNQSFDSPYFGDVEQVDYGLPGTTEDIRPRAAVSVEYEQRWRMPSDFVGTLEAGEQYLVSAMDFKAFSHPGGAGEVVYDTNPDAAKCYGGAYPPHENDLQAKKAWFFLDGYAVCLGAGIRSAMGSPVRTYVENRRVLPGKQVWIDGKFQSPGTQQFLPGTLECITAEGAAAYTFLDASRVCVQREMRRARSGTESDMLEIYIDHGENPDGASYAYAVAPEGSSGCAAADARVIFNTPALQAVCSGDGSVCGRVFYTPGTCCGITVDAPCMVLTRQLEKDLLVYVCEPTSGLRKITVEVEGGYCLQKSSREIMLTAIAPRGVTLTVDVSDTLGKTVYAHLAGA